MGADFIGVGVTVYINVRVDKLMLGHDGCLGIYIYLRVPLGDSEICSCLECKC